MELSLVRNPSLEKPAKGQQASLMMLAMLRVCHSVSVPYPLGFAKLFIVNQGQSGAPAYEATSTNPTGTTQYDTGETGQSTTTRYDTRESSGLKPSENSTAGVSSDDSTSERSEPQKQVDLGRFRRAYTDPRSP